MQTEAHFNILILNSLADSHVEQDSFLVHFSIPPLNIFMHCAKLTSQKTVFGRLKSQKRYIAFYMLQVGIIRISSGIPSFDLPAQNFEKRPNLQSAPCFDPGTESYNVLVSEDRRLSVYVPGAIQK